MEILFHVFIMQVKIKAVLKCPLQGWEKLAREESLWPFGDCVQQGSSAGPATSFSPSSVCVDILFGINHSGGMSHEGTYAFIILSVD